MTASIRPQLIVLRARRETDDHVSRVVLCCPLLPPDEQSVSSLVIRHARVPGLSSAKTASGTDECAAVMELIFSLKELALGLKLWLRCLIFLVLQFAVKARS